MKCSTPERALHAGAKGYLTKDSPGPVMLGAIRRVLEGGIYVSERLAARVLDSFRHGPATRFQFALGKAQRSRVRSLPALRRGPHRQGDRRATQPESPRPFRCIAITSRRRWISPPARK
ncbi:MAG: hypothetical protein WDN28_07975 [Chthoniobacter sp.]